MPRGNFPRAYVRSPQSYCIGQPHNKRCSCSSTDAHHFVIPFAQSEGVCLKCGHKRNFRVAYRDTTVIQKRDPDLALLASPLTHNGAKLVLPSGYHEV